MADFANAIVEWGPSPESITLLELLKGQLDITDNARDPELSMYLEMAGQAAEKYIDNIIDQRDVTENISISRHPVPARYDPVSGLTSITVDGEDVTANYELFQDEGLSWAVKDRSGGAITGSFDQMTLVYTAGYDPIPADLGFALVQASMSYEAGGAASGGEVKREQVTGVGTIEYSTSDDSSSQNIKVGMLPGVATAVLNLYRRVWA
jgi:hypothetical protein